MFYTSETGGGKGCFQPEPEKKQKRGGWTPDYSKMGVIQCSCHMLKTHLWPPSCFFPVQKQRCIWTLTRTLTNCQYVRGNDLPTVCVFVYLKTVASALGNGAGTSRTAHRRPNASYTTRVVYEAYTPWVWLVSWLSALLLWSCTIRNLPGCNDRLLPNLQARGRALTWTQLMWRNGYCQRTINAPCVILTVLFVRDVLKVEVGVQIMQWDKQTGQIRAPNHKSGMFEAAVPANYLSLVSMQPFKKK